MQLKARSAGIEALTAGPLEAVGSKYRLLLLFGEQVGLCVVGQGRPTSKTIHS